MRGIRVKDLVAQGYLACDLRDFLDLLGATAVSSQWLVSGDVWATGERSQELEALGDVPTRIPGLLLRELADGVTQVIDGEFAGYEGTDAEPWVISRAVDSSYYELFCREKASLRKARERFRNVCDCEFIAEPGSAPDGSG
jgi:hypothetical protein